MRPARRLTSIPIALLVLLAIGTSSCTPAQSDDDNAPYDLGDDSGTSGLAEETAGGAFALIAETAPDYAHTYAVDAADSLVVFGRGSELVVIDVAEPGSPSVLGSVTLGGVVRDVVIRGRWAYAATDSAGLSIIELADPAAPVAVGVIRFGDRAYGVDVSAGRAYVAARSEGLRIVDVADPAAPVEIGHYPTPDEAVDVVLRDEFAYVAAWYESMRVVDISDPRAPVEVSFASYDSYDNGAAWSVHVDGDLAVQAVPDMGLRTIDVTDPHNVKLFKVYRGLFAPAGAAVRGRTAYVADQKAGFRILDLADPVRPVEIGALDIPGSAIAVTLSGDVAFLAAREGGLRVIDVSKPYAPRETAYIDPRDEVVDLAIIGDTLAAAGRQNGVAIYAVPVPGVGIRAADVRNDSRPAASAEIRRTGTESSPASTSAVEPLAEETAGDSAPMLRRVGFLGRSATRAASSHGLLFVGYDGGLNAYRLTDLAQPTATATLPGTVQGVAATEEVIVAAVQQFGLRILALDDLRALGAFEPERARLAATGGIQMLRTPVAAWDVVVDGRLAYAAFDDGIRVVDLSSPAQPALAGLAPTRERAYRLALRGSRLFAACDDGLRVFDVSDPRTPTEVGYLKTPSLATALAVHGDYIYVGDLSGIIIIAMLPDTPESSVSGSAQNSPPHSLNRVAEARIADRILDISILENGIAVAAGAQGVRVVAHLPDSLKDE